MLSEESKNILKWYIQAIVYQHKPYENSFPKWQEWSISISEKSIETVFRFHDFSKTAANGDDSLDRRLYAILAMDYYYKWVRTNEKMALDPAKANEWAKTLSKEIMLCIQIYMKLSCKLVT